MPKSRSQLDVSLTVTFIREGNQFIAYSPALDLSTAGATLEEAKKRFTEALDIFIKETTKNRTLTDVLTDLGWQQSNNNWVPPMVVAHDSEVMKIPLPA
ncbi:MAG: hypothetical protein COV09_00705 [Candidatus Vogelbacteria bacterium CG10_big_fil_rev_8_21_14_0_10_50_13]|uniref:Type II toxin-antitoxin system HicB family antitoxin n=1 Tax=Candidatus Vogelbacteria bacterium CG10_big_fil_rev_8_21_14_0_10_50_13 TaxID=1975044 RepID=A0A2H0RGI6_9BACT|nr:MAG: hypothetical protein COV09_00705 [Candidatus Vogelbacteria bacterium CG10_big_fil_rev_8_21_14_0_10_50_13]